MASHERTQPQNMAFRAKATRTARRESQETFWSRFGISQSCGSRFENGENLPFPIYLLLHFYIEGQITDRQLADLRGKTRE
ncbi:quorum-sensing transcriptional regulator RsaL [Pseudomonas aeruginosa]|uniref:quorum-sensing transcriptional regulator RsaL n=1 Tax=Pseudomonas aeruginosa TaxID=287 RepID=UPI0023595F3F|nr:quorum-sensing transcriptional regulator RsaL [Pseudomonas aeruginosa]MDU0713181.1 quorum-sensing transcriptional regulator RsaL [Pseudomonas aeruginosa]